MRVGSGLRRRFDSTAALVAVLVVVGVPGLARAQSAAEGAGTPFDCVIEPERTVKLASPVVGVIARMDVDRGDIVTTGQLLGKLEDGVEEANVALAKAKALNDFTIKGTEAKLEFLRSKEGRTGQLMAKSFGSQAAAQEAQADARVAEEQLKEAKLNLELAKLDVVRAEEVLKQRRLYSPIDGIVVERLLVPGEYRNEQSPILTLAQINPLRVEVFLPTAYYGQVQVGSAATVMPEEPIGGSFAATVTVVDKVLDAASGTYGVRLKLPNPKLELPAGIRCRIKFQLQPARHDPSAGEASARPALK
jgi:RND family efflux transporter MFP subunit